MGWAERLADEQERREEQAVNDSEMVEKISNFLEIHSHVTGGEIGEAGQYLDALRSIMNGDR